MYDQEEINTCSQLSEELKDLDIRARKGESEISGKHNFIYLFLFSKTFPSFKYQSSRFIRSTDILTRKSQLMLKPKLIFILLLLSATLIASTQPIIFINAGSRANRGNHQELIIEKNGDARYFLRQLNGPALDSIYFKLTTQQLDSIFQKAEAVGFFNLQNNYQSGAVDGAGIYISMNSSGKIHNVNLNNIDVPAINELITLLNSMLRPQRIRIYYGQK